MPPKLTALYEYIWERCEADDHKTREILDKLSDLLVGEVEKLECPAPNPEERAYQKAVSDAIEVIKKVLKGGNNAQ